MPTAPVRRIAIFGIHRNPRKWASCICARLTRVLLFTDAPDERGIPLPAAISRLCSATPADADPACRSCAGSHTIPRVWLSRQSGPPPSTRRGCASQARHQAVQATVCCAAHTSNTALVPGPWFSALTANQRTPKFVGGWPTLLSRRPVRQTEAAQPDAEVRN